MIENSTSHNSFDPHKNAEGFRTRRTDSEADGTVPNSSEDRGSIPKGSEAVGSFRKSARSEHHILTVREVARMFEEAGVPRTERSIVNWCRANRHDLSRLDAFFDSNERKYFITEKSVERAIEEEKVKADATASRGIGAKILEEVGAREKNSASRSADEVEALGLRIRDLEITNRAKDYFIDQLKKDREFFVHERQEYVKQLMSYNREIGELKSQSLRSAPDSLNEASVHHS